MLSLLIFWMCLGCVSVGEWVGVNHGVYHCVHLEVRTISNSQFSYSNLFDWDRVSFVLSCWKKWGHWLQNIWGFTSFSPESGSSSTDWWTTDTVAQTLTLKPWALILLVQLVTLRELTSSPLSLALEQNRKKKNKLIAIKWKSNLLR